MKQKLVLGKDEQNDKPLARLTKNKRLNLLKLGIKEKALLSTL